MVPSSSRVQVPIVPGDSFVEPLSGKLMKVSSCRTFLHPGQEEKILPCAGGYQSFLDASVLVAEGKVLDAVRELKDGITG